MTDTANTIESGPVNMTGAAADVLAVVMDQMGQLWSAPYTMWSAVAIAWQSFLKNRGVPAVYAVLDQMVKPDAWTEGFASLLDELQRILALPELSDLPVPDHKALPSLGPTAELIAVANHFVLAAVPLWAGACQRFQAEVAAHRRADAHALDNTGDALDIWNNVLDQTLMEFNRSAEFAQLQQRLLRALMGQRQEARKFGERIAQMVDLPTRTELDEVYRRLHDLLREVHGLRRELHAPKRRAALPPKLPALAKTGAST